MAACGGVPRILSLLGVDMGRAMELENEEKEEDGDLVVMENSVNPGHQGKKIRRSSFVSPLEKPSSASQQQLQKQQQQSSSPTGGGGVSNSRRTSGVVVEVPPLPLSMHGDDDGELNQSKVSQSQLMNGGGGGGSVRFPLVYYDALKKILSSALSLKIDEPGKAKRRIEVLPRGDGIPEGTLRVFRCGLLFFIFYLFTNSNFLT